MEGTNELALLAERETVKTDGGLVLAAAGRLMLFRMENTKQKTSHDLQDICMTVRILVFCHSVYRRFGTIFFGRESPRSARRHMVVNVEEEARITPCLEPFPHRGLRRILLL